MSNNYPEQPIKWHVVIPMALILWGLFGYIAYACGQLLRAVLT